MAKPSEHFWLYVDNLTDLRKHIFAGHQGSDWDKALRHQMTIDWDELTTAELVAVAKIEAAIAEIDGEAQDEPTDADMLNFLERHIGRFAVNDEYTDYPFTCVDMRGDQWKTYGGNTYREAIRAAMKAEQERCP